MKTLHKSEVILVIALLAACASTPKTIMLVPSRSTAAQLVQLSHQSGTTAEVLTTGRERRQLRLDGAGGGALTGLDLEANTPLRIPFDEIALVYSTAGGTIVADTFPALPGVGPAERLLGCEELAVELGRTEAIRWFARQQGAVPFTAHEAAVQHGKNGLKDVGIAALVVLAIGGCAAGGCGSWGSSYSPPPSISVQAYRWAATRADQREIELLELKSAGHCEARATSVEPATDLVILEKIEESRRAMSAKAITDRQQMELQSEWLDRLYGPAPMVLQTLPATASASMAGREFDGVIWYANRDGAHHPFKTLDGIGMAGRLSVTDEGLQFVGQSPLGKADPQTIVARFTDLSDAAVCQFGAWRGIVLTYRNSHTDTFSFDSTSKSDRDLTQSMRNWLKSKLADAPL